MDFRISGLPAAPFIPFFSMTDVALHANGARRVVAQDSDAPLMQPCRVSLRDSVPGETSILLHFPHLAMPSTPYRAAGPIFVRQGVSETACFVNHVPEQQRTRLLSVRAYDADGIMVDAEVADGTELEPLIARLFRRDGVAFLHAHNARRGCYSCRIDRVLTTRPDAARHTNERAGEAMPLRPIRFGQPALSAGLSCSLPGSGIRWSSSPPGRSRQYPASRSGRHPSA